VTYSTQLSALRNWISDATLVVEGIPFVFGTSEGLSIGTTSTPALDIINPETNPLVSVSAIVPGSVMLGESKLDLDRGWVGPQEAQMRIASDVRWDKFFERRRVPITRLSAAVTHSGGTLNVGSSTGFVNDDIVYVDNEAMKVTGTTATTISVTRNYQTLTVTRQTSHRAGSLVSIAPRNLLGRACEFRLWLGDGRDSEKQDPLYLSASPQYNRNEGVWELTFNSAIKHFDRKCHVGFRGSSVTGFVCLVTVRV